MNFSSNTLVATKKTPFSIRVFVVRLRLRTAKPVPFWLCPTLAIHFSGLPGTLHFALFNQFFFSLLVLFVVSKQQTRASCNTKCAIVAPKPQINHPLIFIQLLSMHVFCVMMTLRGNPLHVAGMEVSAVSPFFIKKRRERYRGKKEAEEVYLSYFEVWHF